nr:phospholipase A2 inhibitor and Ly6/PLAUR domain-containing protein-like [Chelonoidis abingdonii]
MWELLRLCVLAALLGTGGAISCYNCTSSEGYNCTTNQATCTSAVNSCITIARDEEQGDEDKEKTVYEKKCNSDDRLCNQFYGLTAGTYHLRWNSTCCRADSCNVPEITLQPSSRVPNGLRCRSCFARGSDVCVPTEVLNCTGLQTRCIQFAATAGQGPRHFTKPKLVSWKRTPLANTLRVKDYEVQLDFLIVRALGAWDPCNKRVLQRLIVSDTI